MTYETRALPGAGVMTDGIVRGEDGVRRCYWADSAPEYREYHDREWGFPVADDIRLFEKLSLEGFQAGLSWLTILRKRENFRRAFAGFDFRAVARFGERDVERLLGDASIIRHRGKIEAAINNAGRAVELVEAEGSLAAYVWRFEPARRPRRRRPRGRGRRDGRIARARQGPQAARVAVRRTHDRVRVHAGDGSRQRPHDGVRGSRPGRAIAEGVRAPAAPAR